MHWWYVDQRGGHRFGSVRECEGRVWHRTSLEVVGKSHLENALLVE